MRLHEVPERYSLKNILSDDLHVRWPFRRKSGVRITGNREVIHQSIHPDVNGLGVVIGDANAPVHSFHRPRYRHVRKGTLADRVQEDVVEVLRTNTVF